MKNLKKIISVLLLSVLIIGAYGCGTKSPSDVTKTYFEELKKGTNGDFTKMLDDSLQSAEKTNKSDSKENNILDESSKKIINSMAKLTYTINSEKIDGDSATVNVKVNGPDMSKVLSEYMEKAIKAAMANALSGDKVNEDDQKKLFENILSECLDNITYTERTGDISLKKSNGEWKIDADDSLKKLLLGIDASTFNNIKDTKEN